MNPTFEHGGVSSYCGDNRAVLAALPEKSVQTCVTSPPYFGLPPYYGIIEMWLKTMDNSKKVNGEALQPSLRMGSIGACQSRFVRKNISCGNTLKNNVRLEK